MKLRVVLVSLQRLNEKAAQSGIVPLLDRRVERVHVHVQNPSNHFETARPYCACVFPALWTAAPGGNVDRYVIPVLPNPPRVISRSSFTSSQTTRGAGRTMPCASRSPRLTFTSESLTFMTWIITSSFGPE